MALIGIPRIVLIIFGSLFVMDFKSTAEYHQTKVITQKRLIQIRPGEPAKWMTEKEIDKLVVSKHNGYLDLTYEELHGKISKKYSSNSEVTSGNLFDFLPTQGLSHHLSIQAIPNIVQFQESPFPPREWPSAPRYSDLIKTAIKKLNQGEMSNFVKSMSDFHTRYAYKTRGYTPNPEKFLFEKVDALMRLHPQVKSTNFTISYDVVGPQGATDQKNLIARLEGTCESLKDEIIILGAHQDTINKYRDETRAPGADDNASGMSVLLETLRVLLESGFVPKRSVEFHWYMGEEKGLIGSNAVAFNYHLEGKHVAAMLNMDLVGYPAPEKLIGIYTDFVNEKLTKFIEMLATEFLDYKWKNRVCKYFCSDHVSWTRKGYPSAFVSEILWNPDAHTAQDTIEKLSFEQVNEFAKLAVAFIVETAEPKM